MNIQIQRQRQREGQGNTIQQDILIITYLGLNVDERHHFDIVILICMYTSITEGARVSVYHEGGHASSLSMDAKLGGEGLICSY
jgi:hypothetical protein